MSVACYPYEEQPRNFVFPCDPMIKVQRECEFYQRNEHNANSAHCKFKQRTCTNRHAQVEATVEKRMDEI